MESWKPRTKKVYLISPRIENDTAEYYQQVLKDHFENPNEYLKEDCNEKIIVGKKSNKPKFESSVQSGVTQLTDFNIKGRRNLRANTNLNKLPNISSDNMSFKQTQEDSVWSNMNYLTTNLSNNYKSYSRMQSSIRTNIQGHNHVASNVSSNYKSKNGWKYLDTNQVNEYIRKIELNYYKNSSSNQTGFEHEFYKECSSKDQDKLQREFMNQEINLSSIQYKEAEDQEMTNRLSLQLKLKQEAQNRLLIKRSADDYRKKIEEVSNLQYIKNHFAGDSYDDWKNKLRSDYKKDKKKKLKTDKLSIWSTISYGTNSNMEIIRKPDLATTSRSKDSIIQNLKKTTLSKLNKGTPYKFGDFDFNNTKTKQLSFEDSNSFASITARNFMRESCQKEIDIKSMTLVGEDLFKVEKNNAMSIKGKKVLLKNNEKGKFDEEMILCDYSDMVNIKVSKMIV